MEAGIPREVTLAPRVAPMEVIEVTVGVVTVGIQPEKTCVGVLRSVLSQRPSWP